MKIAKIMKLEAENFMGVKSFNYDFNGKNMIIEYITIYLLGIACGLIMADALRK